MTNPLPLIVVSGTASRAQLLEAAAIIARGESRVVFDGLVSLTATPGEIRCEVVDPTPGAHRCAEEFEVLKENAARALERSGFARLLPARPWRWTVAVG